MELAPLSFMLSLQLDRAEAQFRDTLAVVDAKNRTRRRHRLEGILSDTWQAYCGFVRQLCIRSSTGCTGKTGSTYAASIVPANWRRASYIAICAAKPCRPRAALENDLLWKEPTWGDSAKVIAIVRELNPGNAGVLTRFLAGGLTGPKHCQIVRNACAHRNHQNKAKVELLAPSYIATPIHAPTDALSWRDPTTNDFAFVSWLDDMRAIADGAVS